MRVRHCNTMGSLASGADTARRSTRYGTSPAGAIARGFVSQVKRGPLPGDGERERVFPTWRAPGRHTVGDSSKAAGTSGSKRCSIIRADIARWSDRIEWVDRDADGIIAHTRQGVGDGGRPRPLRPRKRVGGVRQRGKGIGALLTADGAVSSRSEGDAATTRPSSAPSRRGTPRPVALRLHPPQARRLKIRCLTSIYSALMPARFTTSDHLSISAST